MEYRHLSRPVVFYSRSSKKYMRLQDNKVIMVSDNPFRHLVPLGFHWIIEKLEENRYTIRGLNSSSYFNFMNGMSFVNQQVVAKQFVPFRNSVYIWNIIQSSSPDYLSIISESNKRWLDGRNHQTEVIMSDRSRQNAFQSHWLILPGLHH